MKLKTITAKSMPDALAEVRRQLGHDAVVLHTRSVKRGGVLGLGARTCVEVTAGDGREIARERSRRRADAKRSAASATAASATPPRSAAAESRRTPEPPRTAGEALRQHPAAGDLIRRTYQAARADLAKPAASASTATLEPEPNTAAPRVTTGGLGEATRLHEELREVKRLVARAMRKHGDALAASTPGPGGDSDALVDHYLALIRQEVAEELAERVLHDARGTLARAETQAETDAKEEPDAAQRRAVIEALCRQIPVDAEADRLKPTDDGRPRTLALVGPTGVGKTTTVAKLAATFKLKQSKRVELITLDTYRIAAVDQLRTYAGIIGVPLHVASTPEQAGEAVRACTEADVILIDTAGRSPSDEGRLNELRAMLRAAKPHETHLVLSAAASEAAMARVVERFDRIDSDRIIVTKLDEAVTFGVLLNLPRLAGKPLSFITTGQEVPHQIEVGRAPRLAELVLGEGSVEA